MTSETSDSYPPQRIIGRKIGFTVEPPSLILVYFDHKHAKSRVRRFPLTVRSGFSLVCELASTLAFSFDLRPRRWTPEIPDPERAVDSYSWR